MVKITVPSKKVFLVHADKLISESAYFRAALAGDFMEAKTKEMAMEDVSDVTFVHFLKWVYSRNIRPAENSEHLCYRHHVSALNWDQLLDLWFFADYCQLPNLQNHVVDNLVQKVENFYNAEGPGGSIASIVATVKTLWTRKGHTTKGSLAKPLRDLFLDFVGNAKYMAKSDVQHVTMKQMPDGFVLDFAMRSVQRFQDVLFIVERLRFHLSDDDVESELDNFKTLNNFKYLKMDDNQKVDYATVVAHEFDVSLRVTAEKYYVKVE